MKSVGVANDTRDIIVSNIEMPVVNVDIASPENPRLASNCLPIDLVHQPVTVAGNKNPCLGLALDPAKSPLA